MNFDGEKISVDNGTNCPANAGKRQLVQDPEWARHKH